MFYSPHFSCGFSFILSIQLHFKAKSDSFGLVHIVLYLHTFFCVSVIDCGEPPLLNNTHITLVNGTVYSSLVTYTCSDHHVFNNDSLQTETHTVCTEHGNWSRIMYPEGCEGVLKHIFFPMF